LGAWLVGDKDGNAPRPPSKRGRLDPRSFLGGDPFTEGEVNNAIAYLYSKNLIRGVEVSQPPYVVRPAIMPPGEDVIRHHGGSISAYLNQGASVPTNQIITHFHGDVSGSQVGIGGIVNQTQNRGVKAEDLAVLLQAVREASAGLEDSDRALAARSARSCTATAWRVWRSAGSCPACPTCYIRTACFGMTGRFPRTGSRSRAAAGGVPAPPHRGRRQG
jgi:hypothetical protein